MTSCMNCGTTYPHTGTEDLDPVDMVFYHEDAAAGVPLDEATVAYRLFTGWLVVEKVDNYLCPSCVRDHDAQNRAGLCGLPKADCPDCQATRVPNQLNGGTGLRRGDG